jgi:uncharacterized protein GlcG (DUF336 family)
LSKTRSFSRAWRVANLSCLVATACAVVAGAAGFARPAEAALPSAQSLTVGDVNTVLGYAANQAQALGVRATIAVVDRVGNVLAVMRTSGQTPSVLVSSARGVNYGLDDLQLTALGGPVGANADAFAAIAKAVTGAYLSSSGNAFTTRTASQIVQQFFNPQEVGNPGGPLFGVQFSQLPCSDLSVRFASASGDVSATRGPKRSPLGLSADPGGFPLYKNGVVVGGVGAISDATYNLDKYILDVDVSADERIALAGTARFQAPTSIRANTIYVNGRTLRYSDSGYGSVSIPATTPAIPGTATFPAVPGYTAGGGAIAGQVYGTAASGYILDTSTFGIEAVVLANAGGTNRFVPTASTVPATGSGGLTAPEVTRVISEALKVAYSARAQIRNPVGSFAQVTVSVVDRDGNILGIARTPDAPVFGTDVSLQKARSAALFSRTDAGTILNGAGAQAVGTRFSPISSYVTRFRSFVQAAGLSNGIAYSARAVGNLARPFYPDGSSVSGPGPLSAISFARWSPFSDGVQLDLIANDLVTHLTGTPGADPANCGTILGGTPVIRNGLQIFAGGVPIYRNGVLIGAVGVSGDGIDQDDMIGFLGLGNAGKLLGTGVGNAPPTIRADTLTPGGVRLRYVNCPYQPFLNSSVQNACTGL